MTLVTLVTRAVRPVVGACALALVAAFVLPAPSAAGELPPKLRRKVADSVRSLGEFMASRDAEIPQDMVGGATCIAVLPDVAKGAIGVGGRYGKGLVSCRHDGAWSPPSFIEISGVSFGLQIGGQAADVLMVVRNEKGIDYLLRDRFTLGADASVAAGPIGRTAGAATDLAMQAGILVWSRARGAFIGAAIDGASVGPDKTDNKKLYGKRVTMRQILLPEDGDELPAPAATKAWTEALTRLVPP